jgi:hypothetical protein
MTKAQRADAMLWAAKWWQNGRSRKCSGVDVSWWNFTEDLLMDTPDINAYREWDLWASAALSEVGALGYSIEGAEVWDRAGKVWRK